ncbi:MAG: 50S ribosomal protein L35 [Tenericutes bacterium]|nr:50S ribosomal protein L35 [Mycoplasmatota bacterium]
MPKQKSHKGISKKIVVRNSGSTKIGHVGANHNSGKKSTDFNRKARKVSTLSTGDAKRYKRILGGK